MLVAPLDRAGELHARGVSLYNRGQPARALPALQRALALLPADGAGEVATAEMAARVWITVAAVQAELRSVDEGLAALAVAETYAEQVADPAVDVLLRCQRGLIELRSGSLGEARRWLDAAAQVIEHGDVNAQSSILLNRGTVALNQGRLDDARGDFQRSAGIAERAGAVMLQFKSLHNLGYVEFLRGDLSRALLLMEEAGRLDLGQEWGVALLDRAQILIEAGLSRAADDVLSRAADIFRRDRLGQDLAEVELERARGALARGEVRSARRFAGAARRRFVRRGSDRWRRAAELVLLQADLADGRSGTRLAAPAERLAAEFDREGLRLHARAARLIRIEALLAAGRSDAAAAALAALPVAGRDDPVTGRLHDHYVRARAEAALGASVAAAARVRRGLGELARYQASFGSIDLRTASAVHGRRLAELDIAVALDGGRPAMVFAAAERARAVSSRLPAVRPPDDAVAADLLAELRQVLEALRAVEQDRAASEPLLRKRRELERAIVARSWTVSGSGSVDRPASLDVVRAELAQRGRGLVTYVQAGGRLCAIVVGSRVRVHQLGPAAPVVEQVRRIRADFDVLAHPGLATEMRAAVRTSLDRSLHAVDGALLSPLDVSGPLVLVSTGTLGQLPWASLPSLRGRSVVVAPSATKWLSSAAVAPSAAVVAALAGPDLGRGVDEVAAVGSAWPGADVREGSAATAAALVEAMMTADVLHVAAHGVHQPENPLFSSVRMVDGPVFAHELDRNGRAPSHVALSACEVGLATIRPGDEALGLASVLLHLGTRSVIAGVARVGDDVAAETMAAYHAKLARGADSSAALAEALVEADTDVTPPFVNFGAAWAANLETASPVA